MIVDIVIIIIILLAGLTGYLRGFFKQLYGLVALIISIVAAYFLKDMLVDFVFSKINFAELPEFVMTIISDMLAPLLSALIIFINVYIILRITIFILVKTNVLTDEKKPRALGLLINVLMSVFLLSFLVLPISLTDLLEGDLEKYDLYTDSKLSHALLEINTPVKDFSNNIKELYTKGIELVNIFSDFENSEGLSEEQIDIIKDLATDNPITKELIIQTSKMLFEEIKNQGIELNFEDFPFEEIKEEFQKTEQYPMIKELYDEGIITDSIIEGIINENDIQGIEPEEIINLFK